MLEDTWIILVCFEIWRWPYLLLDMYLVAWGMPVKKQYRVGGGGNRPYSKAKPADLRLCGSWRATISSVPERSTGIFPTLVLLIIDHFFTHLAVLTSEPHWINLTNKCHELQCQMHFPQSRLTRTFESILLTLCFVYIPHLKGPCLSPGSFQTQP